MGLFFRSLESSGTTLTSGKFMISPIRGTEPEGKRLAVSKGLTAIFLKDTIFALIGNIKYLLGS